MFWLTAIATATPLLIATGVGLRWLGQQVWTINQLLATQYQAIRWQSTKLEEMCALDERVEAQIDRLHTRVSDIERYLETQTPTPDRPFVIRGSSTQTQQRTRHEDL